MKRIPFYAGRNRSGNLLHIETDGCVVNIHVGLSDADGRDVTSVRVSPDDASRGGDGNGRIWVRDGSRIVRLHPGETALPADPDEPGQTGIWLTGGQLREWAGLGRNLTADELETLAECIPNSSIPEAIGTIVTEAMDLPR